jgi:glycosyltransferase involved in cell wall biosynthesis
VSEFSKRELVDLLGVAPDRVTVVPEGVDERFRPDADPAAAIVTHGLRLPYVLVVGTVSTRKNLSLLEAAAKALRGLGVDLVVAGSDRRYLRASAVPLRRLGYVADEHLPGLYAGARALAMPSLYEGFGLPCLEAMACGTPVVATSSGALPEVVDDAGLLIEPGDADAFADALVAAACDERVRERLSDAGRGRAAAFTWDRTATLTDAAIGALL